MLFYHQAGIAVPDYHFRRHGFVSVSKQIKTNEQLQQQQSNSRSTFAWTMHSPNLFAKLTPRLKSAASSSLQQNEASA